MNKTPRKRLLFTSAIILLCSIQPVLASVNIEHLVATCAPAIHPNTMLKILKHESGLQPYIIGVNERPRAVFNFGTPEEAAQKARELIAQGKSIDMGLGQINSVNLAGLKLTPEQVFEPCTNIKAAAFILAEAYERTREKYPDQAIALDQALSIYNTGRVDRGIANGYVRKVRGERYVVPALDAGANDVAPAAEVAAAGQPAEQEGPPPSWDVFGNAQYRGRRGSAAAAPAEAQQPAAAETAPVMLFGEPQ